MFEREVSISEAMDLNFFSSSSYNRVLSLLCVCVCVCVFSPSIIKVFISEVVKTLALVVFLSLAVNI